MSIAYNIQDLTLFKMPMARFIDRYHVILIDVCSTLMFNHDRFGPGEDYFSTYTQLAGNSLSPTEVSAIIQHMFEDIVAAEKLEANYDPFPSLRDFLLRASPPPGLPEDELWRIENVFAQHECGRIPHTVADAVLVLSETHPLGIVSNIWSLTHVFEAELARAGIRDLFQVRVWSSDLGCLKPAGRIFQAALEYFDLPNEQVLYVGDTFMRDVVGAKRLGMAAAWVNANGIPVPQEYQVEPDLIVGRINDLLAA